MTIFPIIRHTSVYIDTISRLTISDFCFSLDIIRILHVGSGAQECIWNEEDWEEHV